MKDDLNTFYPHKTGIIFIMVSKKRTCKGLKCPSINISRSTSQERQICLKFPCLPKQRNLQKLLQHLVFIKMGLYIKSCCRFFYFYFIGILSYCVYYKN